ncbi:hypothetical protein [Spirosoma sordidisoli]|uniref:Uncharacterized protein n=1 Tax=Spirosoma sordidisoli TaxID=2502893 RepID=A0A4V1RWA0_9BACT|nr:hypothetical protein [Spirosoma sordidisoli]RYC69538.1 hypothetical protein EQG79_13105 [Spirosoma sordidisoli]
MKKLYPFWVGSCALLLTSCLNIKSVNTFSTATQAGLQPSPALPVTFERIYRYRTLTDSLSRHPFNRIPVIGLDFDSEVGRDSLASYRRADSLMLAGTTLLVNYFKGIAALSATGSSFKPVQLKSASFDAFMQGSVVKLTPEETVAFNRVLSVVGTLATSGYRQRTLKALLNQSYPDVRQVLGVLIFAHERLADVVAISREQQYNTYKNGLIRDPALSYTQKRELAQQWLRTSQETELNRQAVQTHVKTLSTIRAGYDQLYASRNHLTRKDLVSSLGGYVATLQQLHTDLEQLRPVYGRLVP